MNIFKREHDKDSFGELLSRRLSQHGLYVKPAHKTYNTKIDNGDSSEIFLYDSATFKNEVLSFSHMGRDDWAGYSFLNPLPDNSLPTFTITLPRLGDGGTYYALNYPQENRGLNLVYGEVAILMLLKLKKAFIDKDKRFSIRIPFVDGEHINL